MSYQDALTLLKNLKQARTATANTDESHPFVSFDSALLCPHEKIEALDGASEDSSAIPGTPPSEHARAAAVSSVGTPQGQREPIDWLSDYEERAALREFDGQRTRPDAERLSWGEMQNEWHRLHGKPTPVWRCAGCGEPIGGRPVLAFPDGARAHDSLDCIAAYGKRWRSTATAALIEMGLPRPAAVPEDEP